MRQKHGYTLIELVLVLFLLILIAISVFTLAVTGSQSFLRLESNQRHNSDLRIGISYLDVKLKQNDRAGAIEAVDLPGTSQSALRISRQIGDQTYYTWIYAYDEYLCELFIQKGREFEPELGSRIAPAADLSVARVADDAMQVVLTGTDVSGGSSEITRVFHLRTGGDGQ